ncbi:anti-sigma factor [Stakelama marina]|uniref:Anti-sigma factor n=1 Tax=Stakelama marina TaxID=2826939 RepID=A0A8T4IE64_9SPHN|nr:anti-sigma factor [Stakelama marina]MBR0552937.1 anti-sigma factor [Stakelama marina]
MAEGALPRDEWEALAAERALGVIAGEDLARAMRLELSDPDFAAEVEAWHRRFGALFAEVEPVSPPEGVWQAIATRIQAASGGSVSALRAVRRWRAGAVAATVVAACLALVLLFRGPTEQVPVPVPSPTSAGPMAVAQLSGPEADSPSLAARYDPADATLHVSASKVSPASGMAPELWVIPDDGVPRSLGLIPAKGTSQVTVPQGDRSFLTDGSVLALTYEDAQTAPHEKPGMAPVALGTISVL